MAHQTVGEFFVERLEEWGVKIIFGYPGDGINGVLRGLEKAGDKFTFVQARHEEMAAFMASAYAKFSGETGICLSTGGPGATHMVTGLYDAKCDHQPVFAITGQAARGGPRRALPAGAEPRSPVLRRGGVRAGGHRAPAGGHDHGSRHALRQVEERRGHRHHAQRPVRQPLRGAGPRTRLHPHQRRLRDAPHRAQGRRPAPRRRGAERRQEGRHPGRRGRHARHRRGHRHRRQAAGRLRQGAARQGGAAG